MNRIIRAGAWLLALPGTLLAAPLTLTVRTDQPGAAINPAMWGIFFEDINLGADGGLYAELVKNRSFEFPDGLMGWSAVRQPAVKDRIALRNENPFDPANPHYVRIHSDGSGDDGIVNEGFRGMGLRAGEQYDFSLQARVPSADKPSLRIELADRNGNVLTSATIDNLTSQWKKHSATLTPKTTEYKARLRVRVEGKGDVDLDQVSLFPKKTWKNRPGGLRADMVQMLADLKPGFLRFPGGCIVEGRDLANRYQWKNTIGPVEERKLNFNRWNTEFKHRPTPDYYQSYGLGFYEFFQLSEDIGAQPLPIINCGMACQFNTGQLVPVDQLDSYIQDALDLIEFANGPATSTWGAKRAAMGHPEPFHMRMLGVGNEQWGPQYIDRYLAFSKSLKQAHPEIMLVSDAGPSPADDRFQFLWPKLQELSAEMVDQHCYANPIWFLANSHRYDDYDRKGPKIFMGEYAAQSIAIVSPDNQNNLECALAEAAYMTGLERNADVVRMASYAPLFAHVDGWQWTPNLIWADNLRVYGTPSYYAQQLFSLNRGDKVLPVTLDGVEIVAAPAGGIGLATYQTAAEFKDVQVTRDGKTLFNADFAGNLSAWKTNHGKWSVKEGALQQTDPKATGSAVAGDSSWTNYTLTLKARKTGGSEGFLIRVRCDGPENYVEWNLGGFKNKFHTLQAHLAQQDHMLVQTAGSIETGRWYDIKIELSGDRLSCYLDGQPFQSAVVPPIKTQQLYASATRDDQSGEIIVKAINPGSQRVSAQVNLAGLAEGDRDAKIIVLTGSNPAQTNSLDMPRHIAPAESTLKLSPKFDYVFPPRSFTVMRLAGR
jgi:alpha-L-arabinofuranosidase